MFFASDNAGPVHPEILAAFVKANDGHAMGYGNDDLTNRATEKVKGIFEAPDAAVYFVATGTAANSLILATLSRPWETIFCTRSAHIEKDECNAPEFFSGGAKLTLVGAAEDKMTANELHAAIATQTPIGIHNAQRGPVSITQVTERGTLYSLEEIQAISATAKAFNLPVHMDGARFANATEALGCSAADMTWKAGVDAVSFGGTKNGCMGVEAVIFFNPDHAREFELRRKRAAHLFSKHRYLAAQMDAYLTNDLWRSLAQTSNKRAQRLATGLKQNSEILLPFEPKANMIYFHAPRALHQRLNKSGAVYYIEVGQLEGDDPSEVLVGRLVCDWSIGDNDVDQFLELLV